MLGFFFFVRRVIPARGIIIFTPVEEVFFFLKFLTTAQMHSNLLLKTLPLTANKHISHHAGLSL